jgi:hypothetical protein
MFSQYKKAADLETGSSAYIVGWVFVRFQVLTTASLKVTAFWYIASCSVAEVGLRFRGVY